MNCQLLLYRRSLRMWCTDFPIPCIQRCTFGRQVMLVLQKLAVGVTTLLILFHGSQRHSWQTNCLLIYGFLF